MMLRSRLARGFVGAVGAVCLTALLHAATPTDVVSAAMQGDTDGVRSLLKDGADVNSSQGDGMTALHWAALNDKVDLAQMLLYAGANPKATTRLGGYTPLLMAAKNGNAAMIQTLVNGGADPNAPTTNGTTPLMLAAASGNAAAVTFLVDHGAAVNAKEHARGETALMFAAAYGRTDAIRALLAKGADIKVTTKVVDLNAFTKEEQERFAVIVATGAPPAPKGAEVRGTPKREEDTTGEEGPKAEANAADGKAPAKADVKAPAPKAPAAKASEADAAAPQHAEATAASEKPAAKAPKKPQVAGVDRRYLYNELVGKEGGLSPLLIAVRQGQMDSVKALLDAGADINEVSAGDHTSPLLIAVINGRYDIAKFLLDHGANPKLASDNGVTPLYAVLNCQWAPKALYPQPRAYEQQTTSYLDLMTALIDKGADVNARLKQKVWYSGYNFDLSGVDETGATPFWRAAYASDVDGMKLLVARGADPTLPTLRTPGRPPTGDAPRDVKDVSGLPPVPVGGPGVPPLLAASGEGYGEGFAANSHRFAPGGMLAAVKYLVEELHADVNSVDHEGNTALHNAAARGDNEMIQYLVSKGANVKVVNRLGQTTVDMANGPVQRVEPFPDTIALLEKLGGKNNHKCISC